MEFIVNIDNMLKHLLISLFFSYKREQNNNHFEMLMRIKTLKIRKYHWYYEALVPEIWMAFELYETSALHGFVFEQ